MNARSKWLLFCSWAMFRYTEYLVYGTGVIMKVKVGTGDWQWSEYFELLIWHACLKNLRNFVESVTKDSSDPYGWIIWRGKKMMSPVASNFPSSTERTTHHVDDSFIIFSTHSLRNQPAPLWWNTFEYIHHVCIILTAFLRGCNIIICRLLYFSGEKSQRSLRLTRLLKKQHTHSEPGMFRALEVWGLGAVVSIACLWTSLA